MILTQSQLTKKCREWQKVLRLQDWDVTTEICRQRDLKDDDYAGQVRWILPIKQALISLVDPIDQPDNCIKEYDMEDSLVHELLHLHFAPLGTEHGTPEKIAEEQAINAISKALVKLKREAGK
jgi:hypothetical protein